MLTSVFSKLYGSSPTDLLKSKIEKLVDVKQFGNQRGLSITHYHVSLLDTIYKNLKNPDLWLNLLLIDLQKTFDLINHNILVVKLIKEFMLNQIVLK